jgi:hypothetical protein
MHVWLTDGMAVLINLMHVDGGMRAKSRHSSGKQLNNTLKGMIFL